MLGLYKLLHCGWKEKGESSSSFDDGGIDSRNVKGSIGDGERKIKAQAIDRSDSRLLE